MRNMSRKTGEYPLVNATDKRLTPKEKMGIIEDENAPEDLLFQLATDKDTSIRLALAKRRFPLSPRMYDLLLTDPSVHKTLAERMDLPEVIANLLLSNGCTVRRRFEGFVDKLTIRHGWQTMWLSASSGSSYHYYYLDKDFSINGTSWHFAEQWAVNGYGIVPKEASRKEQSFHEGDKVKVDYLESLDTIEVIRVEVIETTR